MTIQIVKIDEAIKSKSVFLGNNIKHDYYLNEILAFRSLEIRRK